MPFLFASSTVGWESRSVRDIAIHSSHELNGHIYFSMHAIMGCSTGAQLCRARIAWAHTLALAAVRLFALCQLDDEGRPW
jgi:hypothetical protein